MPFFLLLHYPIYHQVCSTPFSEFIQDVTTFYLFSVVMLLQATIISSLDYCHSLVTGLPASAIASPRSLLSIQTLGYKSCSVTSLLQSLHYLSVSPTINPSILMLACRAWYELAPAGFLFLFPHSTPATCFLAVPWTAHSCFRALALAVALTWNPSSL